MNDHKSSTQNGRRMAQGAVVAGLVAVLAIPVAGVGRMLGLWGALPAMLYAFVLMGMAALTAVILAAWLLWRRHPAQKLSVAALLLGGVMLVLTGHTVYVARTVPPIHDITTDVADPPAFVAIEELRQAANAPNSTDYDPAVGAQQQAAYPDLDTKILAMPPDQAFAAALNAARAMDWEIVAAVPEAGRIEAYDTTFWAGYVDDVVIRLRPADDGGTALDVRSVSRVGMSDLGQNAARIRAYLAKLD